MRPWRAQQAASPTFNWFERAEVATGQSWLSTLTSSSVAVVVRAYV